MSAPGTEQQRRFALEYASNGGNATAAAKAAGYSAKSAHEIGRQQLEKPHVQQMVMAELTRLRFRSGTVGLNALTSITEDPKAPAAARVAAARALMEHAGMLGSKEAGLPGDPPANVSSFEELLDRMGRSRQPVVADQ